MRSIFMYELALGKTGIFVQYCNQQELQVGNLSPIPETGVAHAEYRGFMGRGQRSFGFKASSQEKNFIRLLKRIVSLVIGIVFSRMLKMNCYHKRELSLTEKTGFSYQLWCYSARIG